MSKLAMALKMPLEARSQLDACTEFAFACPRKCALFLDVDGTLLELAATPRSVAVPAGLIATLERLSRDLGGALAIITGRQIADIDRILAPLQVAASGVHGTEFRYTPRGAIEHVGPALDESTIVELNGLARRTPGAFAEPKGSGIAIHFRQAPAAEGEIRDELRRFIAARPGSYDLWPGKKVFEVIPSGSSKGTALAAFSAMPAFQGRVPIMIGDDVGDEPAFKVAESMGGYALRVAGDHNGTGADFEGPAAVIAWLEAFGDRLSAS